ncbi:P-loop containing nucleoside triphosphate hydrolase protein [Obelidium mucronatum]|nr:P-loop containing nucleoside triphosphate hydrolase protein [Obelidium mucronatum]
MCAQKPKPKARGGSGSKPGGKGKGGKGAAPPKAFDKLKRKGDRPRFEDFEAKKAQKAATKQQNAAKRGKPLKRLGTGTGTDLKKKGGKDGGKGSKDGENNDKTQKKNKFGKNKTEKKKGAKKEEDTEFETVPADDDGWASDVDEADEEDDEEGSASDEEMGDEDQGEEGWNEGSDDGNEENGDENQENLGADDEDEIDLDTDDEDDDIASQKIAKSVQMANKKHKKSGGFQSMGLSYPIYSAIIQKGYKVPTPIQRKAIPIILENRDVVAMARTGSGKTAAFLIPLMERLKTHSAKVGARGLVLTPSRELALQTLKFVKEMGKHTDLRYCMLVGGGTMDDHFAALANNPDIIIATPGRLMHLIIEMNLDLRTIEYVVFDEADRLFEMGFAEQLREILFKLPENRQTLLFSATLPKLLVDFAKAGLTDPALIRLDVDTKISSDLQLLFFSLKTEEKDAALLYLLETVIPKDQQTIIFVATKHVVEYVHELLSVSGIQSTYIFGALDQVARTMHINKFRNGLVKVLIVTDVAARGIDIPLLDNVVNYDFPGSSKVLIHRVGRVGRAGRKGMAFSLIATDELPYLLDFQLFTGRPLLYSSIFDSKSQLQPNFTNDIILGNLPPSALEMDRELVITRIKENVSLQTLKHSVVNGYKMYYRTRGNASKESYARAKVIGNDTLGVHPYLAKLAGQGEVKRASILDEIARFRPMETIFEAGKRGVSSPEAVLMHTRRAQLGKTILLNRAQRSDVANKSLEVQKRSILKNSGMEEQASELELQSTFKNLSESKKRKREAKPASYRDEEFYMSHFQKDAATEKGYAVRETVSQTTGLANNFAERANDVTVDMDGDDDDTLKKKKGNLVWDKKKKQFIRPTVGSDNKKRFKTESGASVLASYKSDRFEQWQKKTRIEFPRTGEQELAVDAAGAVANPFAKKYRYNEVHAANPNSKNFQRKAAAAERQARKDGKNPEDARAALLQQNASRAPMATRTDGRKVKGVKSELKNVDQIKKERKKKEQRKAKNGRPSKKVKAKGKGRR